MFQPPLRIKKLFPLISQVLRLGLNTVVVLKKNVQNLVNEVKRSGKYHSLSLMKFIKFSGAGSTGDGQGSKGLADILETSSFTWSIDLDFVETTSKSSILQDGVTVFVLSCRSNNGQFPHERELA